ncbi:PucR family transcriptional regulator [Cohnella sp. CFH 77786]|uniref:PucR family transcriptional regulator n=1 Tax=Cohnella sp. CFH 77786 TaxID=2662265 RepID=UPI001C608134|nr:PucR family transcriptional regulator [Cohnella sp. CFH 77786]MBW5448541.1 PucR family transcriptional regulator [Cohnella sp. CFH 77786]
MQLTVEQALSVYPLSEAKLVAGFNGMKRIIRAVNVMDAPDITDWIKEGEMVLTTGYLVKDRPDEASRLLEKLDKRGSSGLGIKLGRYWESIPEPMIEQADRLGFPLIELPYRFTFSDQINGLFREEMKRSTGMLQDALEKQIRLMRFALQSDPIRHLFESVAEVVGHPIAVIGSRGQLVYNSSGVPEDCLLVRWPWSVHHGWMRSDGWQAFRIPLMKQSQCTGYALFFNPRTFLSPVEESLYFQAAELIAYHLNLKYEDYFELSVQRDFGQLVKRYLQNGISTESLLGYAERWEIDLFTGPFRCVLIDVSGRLGGAAREEACERLKADLLRHGRIRELKGIHIVMDEGVLSVFPEPEGGWEERGDPSLAACLSAKRLAEGGPRAAISSRKTSASQLHDAFGECLEVRRMAEEWGMAERIVKFETMDLAYVFERVPLERMRAFCDRWLGSLFHRDAEYAQEMMRTLETYLACDGQLNETAKKLFIHRNTATYRMEKLGEILDVDLKKVNDLMRLQLAFLFRRMLAAAEERAL